MYANNGVLPFCAIGLVFISVLFPISSLLYLVPNTDVNIVIMVFMFVLQVQWGGMLESV